MLFPIFCSVFIRKKNHVSGFSIAILNNGWFAACQCCRWWINYQGYILWFEVRFTCVEHIATPKENFENLWRPLAGLYIIMFPGNVSQVHLVPRLGPCFWLSLFVLILCIYLSLCINQFRALNFNYNNGMLVLLSSHCFIFSNIFSLILSGVCIFYIYSVFYWLQCLIVLYLSSELWISLRYQSFAHILLEKKTG